MVLRLAAGWVAETVEMMGVWKVELTVFRTAAEMDGRKVEKMVPNWVDN